MFIGYRRAILVAVIGAIVAFIVLFPAIPDLMKGGNDLKNVNISVENIAVENSSIINNTIPLKVTFKVLNQDSKALTTSKIEFTVNANNTHLGNGIISYENIPPNGRPQLYPNAPTTLQSTVLLSRSNINSELFDNLLGENFKPNNTKWNVNGTAEIDSAFTIYPVKFNSELG